MIRIAICDDEMDFAREVHEKIKQYLQEKKIEHEIIVYNSAQILKNAICIGEYFDMLWLDIQMPYLDGIALAREIRNRLPHIILIFLSAHAKYVYDTFEFNTFRFIPKNQMDRRFEKALHDAVKKLENEKEQYYMIKNKAGIEKISIREIMYIWKDSKNCVIEKYEGEIKVRKTLAQVYEELPQGEFVWVNRGMICNLSQITRVDGNDVVMKNGKKVPVIKGKIMELKSTVTRYWMEKEG